MKPATINSTFLAGYLAAKGGLGHTRSADGYEIFTIMVYAHRCELEILRAFRAAMGGRIRRQCPRRGRSERKYRWEITSHEQIHAVALPWIDEHLLPIGSAARGYRAWRNDFLRNQYRPRKPRQGRKTSGIALLVG